MFGQFWKSRMFWLGHLEARAVETLLRSRKWHEGVGYIHKTVQNAKQGKLPDRPQLMELENTQKGAIGEFLQHFKEEVRNQIKGGNPLKKK